MTLFQIGVVLSGLFLTSVAFATDSSPAHPTRLMAEYRGQHYQVVAVEKEDPVVVIDGRQKRLRGNVGLTSTRMPHFNGKKARVEAARVEVLQLLVAESEHAVEQVKSNPGATLGGYVEYSATITADQDLTKCYLALFAHDFDFKQGNSDRPNAQIRIREIQDLRAGQPTRIKFSSSQLIIRGKMQSFALLFSEGEEVRITPDPNSASYFHARERVIHAVAIKQWLKENSQLSKPVQPLLQIPPILETTDGFPAGATAVLVVSPQGTVIETNLNGSFTPSAHKVLTDTLAAWLFLPRIVNGVPEVSRVTVPLRF